MGLLIVLIVAALLTLVATVAFAVTRERFYIWPPHPLMLLVLPLIVLASLVLLGAGGALIVGLFPDELTDWAFAALAIFLVVVPVCVAVLANHGLCARRRK